MSQFVFNQIGIIRSPYKEKFAIPRQPGLIEDGGGELQLLPPYNQADCVRGLENFSHIWILFIFHQTMEGGWRQRFDHRVWEEILVQAFSLRAPLFAPILSVCRWLN